ncbi:MAG: acetyl esterase [Coriobacteriales bacterium]|nr:acetyl esterase [Coriobacteriales bacterium]
MNRVPVLERINAQMKAVLEKSNELAGDAYAPGATLEQMREGYLKERAFWNEGGPVMFRRIDQTIATPAGSCAIRLHVPRQAAPGELLPAIGYIHGGGFVLGNLDTHDRIMRLLADKTGAVVVGIDYSLSPEAKFPVALEQCVALVDYLRDQGKELGIDADTISLAGDSCGAYLCLATMLYLRDRGAGSMSGATTGDSNGTSKTSDTSDFEPICSLLLFYGLYGLRDSMSRRLLGGSWDGLSESDLRYYYDCYLAHPEDHESPYVDCLRADLTHGMPPCYLAAAQFDPLKDDTATLATILSEGGIRHEHVVFGGVLHAFLHNSRMLDEAMTALDQAAAFYRSVVS